LKKKKKKNKKKKKKPQKRKKKKKKKKRKQQKKKKKKTPPKKNRPKDKRGALQFFSARGNFFLRWGEEEKKGKGVGEDRKYTPMRDQGTRLFFVRQKGKKKKKDVKNKGAIQLNRLGLDL